MNGGATLTASSLDDATQHPAPGQAPLNYAKKVCVYSKAWRSSGSGEYIQAVAYAMAEAGALVTLVAPKPDNPHYQRAQKGLTRAYTPREASVDSPRALRIVRSSWRVLGSIVALIAARFTHRAYLVSIPDPLVFSMPLFAFLRLTGAEITYVVHDPLPHAWRLPKAFRWLELAGFALTYQVASALIVLTPAARDKLRSNFSIGDKPVHVVPHGMFQVATPPPPPGDGKLLLFGSLRRNKGVREAIEGVLAARAQGTRASLIIAGAANGEEHEYWLGCRAIAEAHADAIEVREGFIENDALPALIGQIDAFLMPYRDFNSESGVAILAAANARPLIACAEGGIGAMFAEGAAGVVIPAPADAAAVAGAVAAFTAGDQTATNDKARAYQAVFCATREWGAIGRQFAALTAGLLDAKLQQSAPS